MYDVIIIGAGAVGCAIARELSRFKLRTLVLEKEDDVATGTSGRNSAVVHAGFNNKPGSLMAKLCVQGNEMFEGLCRDLGVRYNKTGKVIIAFDEDDTATLKKSLAQGEANGCKGLRLIDADELHKIAPGVGGIGAMYSPNTAIFDTFGYVIALAENAIKNGAQFKLQEEVTAIDRLYPSQKAADHSAISGENACRIAAGCCEGPRFAVHTKDWKGSEHIYSSRYVINAAGLFCDKISAMVGIDKYKIYPCRGEYYILDRIADKKLSIPAYPAQKPGIGGLGVHFTPTIDGNLIIGPSADYIDDPEDYSNTPQAMEKLIREAKQLLPSMEEKDIIGNYSGVRPKQAPPSEGGFRDFVIKEEEDASGFINLIGIESPGMTASYPIAQMVRDIIGQSTELAEKPDFDPIRKAPVVFRECSKEEQEALIKEDPDYGEVICRCQIVTKKEIKDAIENPLGAKSLAAIKYRAWATTGRCNGGYCMSKIANILIDEYAVPRDKVLRRGRGSNMFTGRVK